MKHLPNNFRYSFTKLSSFKSCPMSFYLQYVCNPDRETEIPNFFAEYGSCAHRILEEFLKGELPQFCLAEEWTNRYPEEVQCPPPPYPAGFGDKAFNAGLKYFETFDGFGDEWDVVSVEEKFYLNIEGYTVSGVADVVLRHKETGEYWIVDHKSKSKSSMRKDLPLYRNQLYLYAIWCKEHFGVYPAKLSFSLFKEGIMVDEVFSESALEETKKWIIDTIHEIEEYDVFEMWSSCISPNETKEPYGCRWICGVNADCEDYQNVRQAAIEEWKAKREAEEAASLGY